MTICFINQKGGCGKTSSCFHLAGALATMERSVLLVDADPQGTLSQAFFGPARVKSLTAAQTLAALFNDEVFDPAAQPIVRPTEFDRISIAPANQNLAPLNQPSPERTGLRQYALREFLEAQAPFDLTLIDCPPNLYTCSWAAMIAADFVIIPVIPEEFGTQGLPAVHQAIDQVRTLNPVLRRLGHLLTLCKSRQVVHRNYEATLRTTFPQMVLKTSIPDATAFRLAATARTPIQYLDAGSLAAQRTRELACEILASIEAHTAKRSAA